ncbi:MAG: DVU0150 family protein [Pseudomonadota bacterium]
MTKRLHRLLTLGAAVFTLLIPELVRAAGGAAEMLIVVADSRRVDSGWARYFVDSYNTNPLWFGVEVTIITALMGVTLGLITDQIMRHVGIDLTSRKIIEH